MNIVFSGPVGDFQVAYMSALLFRDNVQHYLQAGRPTPGYPLVHAIADAPIDGGILRFRADRLWREFSEAFAQIHPIEIVDLAVSIRTRAILTGKSALPSVRGTIPLRLTGWKLPLTIRGVRTLGGLFDDFVKKLALATKSGSSRAFVHVATRDEGIPISQGSSAASGARRG